MAGALGGSLIADSRSVTTRRPSKLGIDVELTCGVQSAGLLDRSRQRTCACTGGDPNSRLQQRATQLLPGCCSTDHISSPSSVSVNHSEGYRRDPSRWQRCIFTGCDPKCLMALRTSCAPRTRTDSGVSAGVSGVSGLSELVSFGPVAGTVLAVGSSFTDGDWSAASALASCAARALMASAHSSIISSVGGSMHMVCSAPAQCTLTRSSDARLEPRCSDSVVDGPSADTLAASSG